MSKSKYIVDGYTPDILRQDPDLPNLQRDAYKKVTLRCVVVGHQKTKEEQDRLNNLRAVVKRSTQPIFNW